MNYYDWINKELDKLKVASASFISSKSRLSTLERVLKDNNFKNALEFGVFEGRTINKYLSKYCENTWGFDSFEGLPENWDGVDSKGKFSVQSIPKVSSNVKLVKGLFNETIPDFFKENKNLEIDFIHIDCDLYSSTKTIFENLYIFNKLNSGLIIVFDEIINYNRFHEGELKALYEASLDFNIKFEWIGTNGDVCSLSEVLSDKWQGKRFSQFRKSNFYSPAAIKIL
tara:strand:+ start:802 stop:1482 length:681 start_codon:yes stop_codon:yes gene_type:complete